MDEAPTEGVVPTRVSRIEPDNPVVARASQGCIEAASPPGDPAGVRASTGRVLVVDDVDGNRALVAALLARDGYAVSAATGGQEALEQVRRTRPDLILLDVMMPGLDGFEVCRILKNDPATRLVPVILITGLQHADDRIRGLDAGADDFISK